MGSFALDQAAGLRRMLAGARPRVFTFVSATSEEDKSAMLVNLGASLAQVGSDVLLLDASAAASGVAARLQAARGASLLQVARGERSIDEVIQLMPQGFGLARLSHGALNGVFRSKEEIARVGQAFDSLAQKVDIVAIDGILNPDDSFPIPAMASGEIVIQVANSAASIKSAYSIIKRLASQLGRRSFGVLVTGATDEEATVVYANMAQAASRYLALQLTSMGSVPADDHLKRASRLGRSVVDAFPQAGASHAFRKLAGRFAAAERPAPGMRGMPVSGVNFGV
ncbi:flagellar biosynthesis protein FlhG [soil metagenome]